MSSSGGGTLAVPATKRGGRDAAPARARAAERGAVGSSRGGRLALRTIALGYLAVLLGAPLAMIFYRTFEHGLAPVWDAITAPNALHAMWLSLEIVLIVVPLNTIFGIGAALLLERGRMPGQDAVRAADRHAVRDLARRRRARAGARLRPGRLVRRRTGGAGHQDHLLGAGHGDGDGARDAAVRRARDDPGAARDGHRLRAGGRDARREPLADVLARHAAWRSAGASATASC